MTNSKRSAHQSSDRLSELPDSVLFHILWFVPMRDVIRTTVLSKRWRNIFITTPCLNFVANVENRYEVHPFRNLVNRALLCWEGDRVLKFKVDSSFKLENSIYHDFGVWLRFAKKNQVEELYLHLYSANIYESFVDVSDNHVGGAYWVPQFLYSCSSLKKLSFRQCNFNIEDHNVQWNRLKSLTITESFRVNSDLVTKILSGCPQLEVLILSFADIGESMNIRSRSLKELSIYKFLYDRDHVYNYRGDNGEPCIETRLNIKAPNLESLEIRGIPFGEHLLTDVSSLTHATIGFSGVHFLDEDNESAYTTIDFLGEKYSQILSSIHHAKHVTLFSCCIEVLGAMKRRCIHSSFPSVKSLQIGYCFNDYKRLVVLLESFPQLKTLLLQPRVDDEHHDEGGPLEFDLKITHPKSFLRQLRTVEVTWAGGGNIFLFMEIVLKCASKLENMIFRLKETSSPSPPSSPSYLSSPSPPPPSNTLLVLASRKLLKMPRTSPKCTIDIM